MNQQYRQSLFVRNVAGPIEQAGHFAIELSFIEVFRMPSQQLLYYHGYQAVEDQSGLVLTKATKCSWTERSPHLCRLAIDFNFFIGGRLTYEFEAVEPLGAYWESLHPDNVWGGRWHTKDVPNFEMKP